MSAKSFKRSFVSRSVYQKLAEENKRLLKDLRTICLGDPVDAIITRIHWRNRFKKEDKFWEDVKAILKEGISKEQK
jgi:hypothetical protein